MGLGPTRSLHVAVANKAALPAATTGFGSAHGLQIAVADEPTLTIAAARCGSAIRLLVGVLNKATLARTVVRVGAVCAGTASGLHVMVSNESALAAPTAGFSSTTCL